MPSWPAPPGSPFTRPEIAGRRPIRVVAPHSVSAPPTRPGRCDCCQAGPRRKLGHAKGGAARRSTEPRGRLRRPPVAAPVGSVGCQLGALSGAGAELGTQPQPLVGKESQGPAGHRPATRGSPRHPGKSGAGPVSRMGRVHPVRPSACEGARLPRPRTPPSAVTPPDPLSQRAPPAGAGGVSHPCTATSSAWPRPPPRPSPCS